MICRNCGAKNPKDAIICSQCNRPVEAEQRQVYAGQPQGYGQPGQGAAPFEQPYGQPGQGATPFEQPYSQPGQGATPPPNFGQPYQSKFHGRVQKDPAESAATASLVFGIIGLCLIGMVFGIVAIVQGRKAKSLGYTGGKATAGIVLGIVAIIVWLILLPNMLL